ncbi:heterokaryon incompatibility protein-domain-containing protein [Hyaloscypha sp. PMI_1271]|nr:heterokaryon incompatibility protein-domain-containing protein [Hyaloscypha sp. PMI_1271]
MTLSHCWGSLQILTTKKDNLNAHKQGIDLTTLPKTFQDAIEVTRSIGIKYLWIDSLCIIQDDIEDWARESSKMASIYRNSYLTLAATGAKDGSEGLYKPREAEIFSVGFNAHGNMGEKATLLARRGKKHDCFQSWNPETHWGEDMSEPLMERAWVYQERLLSRRLLHFASDEMIWECRTVSDCECGFLPQDEPAEIRRRAEENEEGISDRSIFQVLNSEEQATEAASQRWYRLIKSYAYLKITRDDDRLPAFSGIASSLTTAENYMAGLRKDNAVRDLLWFTRNSTVPRRPESYVAPSWSWASVAGHVGHYTSAYSTDFALWNKPGSQALVEVLGFSTVKSTSDPFGRLKSGELKLRGHFAQGVVSEKDRNEWVGTEWSLYRLEVKISSGPGIGWLPELNIDTIEDGQLAMNASVFLLAVWLTERELYFLVLVEDSPRKFRRIGVATINSVVLGYSDGFPESFDNKFLDESSSMDFVII